ncbi:MAG: AraC family transcriptional regulator [Methylacidiphilales bacterium]|nr:AraC family transcriptional regulator [Candidatus Methylacidiphilales bacterium]
MVAGTSRGTLRSLFSQWGTGSTRQLPPHRNSGLEIVCVSQGHLRWRIENRIYEVGPGSVFYTFPWELHGSLDEFEPGHRWDFVIFELVHGSGKRRLELPASFGFSPTEGRQMLTRLLRSPHRSLEAGERIKWLLPTLQRELSSLKDASLPMAATLGRAVLLELDRIREGIGKGRKSSLRQTDRCGVLLRQINTDYASPWTLSRMSQITGLRRTRLGQAFKEQTGDSPITYMNRLRVLKAQESLRHTDLPITDIAFSVGFQSSQYFARTFRHFTGATPQNYRQTWGKKKTILDCSKVIAR